MTTNVNFSGYSFQGQQNNETWIFKDFIFKGLKRGHFENFIFKRLKRGHFKSYIFKGYQSH